jgi:hypothetical protein
MGGKQEYVEFRDGVLVVAGDGEIDGYQCKSARRQ